MHITLIELQESYVKRYAVSGKTSCFMINCVLIKNLIIIHNKSYLLPYLLINIHLKLQIKFSNKQDFMFVCFTTFYYVIISNI